VSTACVTVKPPVFLRNAAERSWPATLATAQQLAAEGDPASADTLLTRFAAAHPGSIPATETLYWRAIYRLDGPFGTGGARDAVNFLSQYLSFSGKAIHRDDAYALRTVADQIVRLNTLVDLATGRSTAANTNAADLAGRAAEARGDLRSALAEIQTQDTDIKRLKDDLAKANAELDRIKKRLAQVQKTGGCC
jgi:hypothetical protein